MCSQDATIQRLLSAFLYIFRTQRRVSFADSVGLDLASIRIMTEGRDTPPFLEQHYKHIEQCVELQSLLCPLFPQPIANFHQFLRQLTDNSVSLESVEITSKAITGMIKVRNLAYEKSVTVRFTTDRWKSYSEVQCSYVAPLYIPGSSSVHDSFTFLIDVDKRWTEVEFCIQYCCQDRELWDNNCGSNYKLALKAQQLECQQYITDSVHQFHRQQPFLVAKKTNHELVKSLKPVCMSNIRFKFCL